MSADTHLIYLQVLTLTFLSVSIQSLEYLKIWKITNSMALPFKIPITVIVFWPLLLALAAALPQFASAFLWLALLIHLLICIRFKGTFNGGSDYMTFATLLGLALSATLSNQKIGLLWIAVGVLLSYFIAGVVKIKEPQWRSGQALITFLRLNRSPLGPLLFSNSKIPMKLVLILSWSVMMIEVLSPGILWHANLKLPLMGFFAFFHFVNFYIFGLNRFFWAWIATYPALFVLPEL